MVRFAIRNHCWKAEELYFFDKLSKFVYPWFWPSGVLAAFIELRWYDTDFSEFDSADIIDCILKKSVSYQKKHGRAHPSFSVTTTKTLRSVFSWHASHDVQSVTWALKTLQTFCQGAKHTVVIQAENRMAHFAARISWETPPHKYLQIKCPLDHCLNPRGF